MKGTAVNGSQLISFLWGVGLTVALMVTYQEFIKGSDHLEVPAVQIATPGSATHEQIHHINKKEIDQDLAELLRKASMDDKTIIMTAVNYAWTAPDSLFQLFLESFRVGDQIEQLLNHMIVVAVDPKALEKCKLVHPYCYLLKVDGVDFTAEKVIDSEDYLKMMWSRNKLQRTILEMGYNFLFTDMDIIWFRNPFKHITMFPQITLSSDWYYGSPDYMWNNANGGFLYVKSTNKTIEFYKEWYDLRVYYPGQHEQTVFEKNKNNLTSKHEIQIRFLDTAYIGSLCQPQIDFSKLCTFHANCRIGLQSKLQELRNVLDGWKKFKR